MSARGHPGRQEDGHQQQQVVAMSPERRYLDIPDRDQADLAARMTSGPSTDA